MTTPPSCRDGSLQATQTRKEYPGTDAVAALVHERRPAVVSGDDVP